MFNIQITHESKIFPEYYPEVYPEATTSVENLDLPPYQVETPEVLRDWQRMYERISDMDSRVGELLRELEAEGVAENTIVFYCSDHAGITLRSKRLLYNSGTHVPFIAYFPEKYRHLAPEAGEGVSDRLVQFIDMPKTFLSLAGARVPAHMPGFCACSE